MKLFLAHDPGGYDAIFPVYRRFEVAGTECRMLCAGPASKLNPEYAIRPEAVLDVIAAYKENLSFVVTGTSWGSELELKAILAGRRCGVPTVSVLDYWSNYSSRLHDRNGIPVYPDYYIVMDELAKEEAVCEGVPENIVHILGHPGLDQYIHSRRLAPRDRIGAVSRLLLLNQPLSQLYGDKLGYIEEQVIRDCISAAEKTGWDINVKFHPKDHDLVKMSYSKYSVVGEVTELIPQYDLVVSMNSMGLLHAVLLGTPGLSYQPNMVQPDLCITNKLGLTPLVTTFSKLVEILDRGPEIDFKSRVDESKFLWLDGKSTDRIYRFLERM